MAIFFLLLSYSLIYYAAPNVDHPRWQWVTPGSVAGVFLWLAASFALREYLQYFNTYSATYGALGAVMILLLWFYVSGMSVLIGGEANSVIERAGMGGTEPRVGGRDAVEGERPAA
jgi:membrane protein